MISIRWVFVGKQFTRSYQEKIRKTENVKKMKMKISNPLKLSVKQEEIMRKQ